MYLWAPQSCLSWVRCAQYILLAENNVEAILLHLSVLGRSHCSSKYRKCRIGQTANWFLNPGPIMCYRVHLSISHSFLSSLWSFSWVSNLNRLYPSPKLFHLHFWCYCLPHFLALVSIYNFHTHRKVLIYSTTAAWNCFWNSRVLTFSRNDVPFYCHKTDTHTQCCFTSNSLSFISVASCILLGYVSVACFKH